MVLFGCSEDKSASKFMQVVGGIRLLAGAGLRAVSLLTDRWESEPPLWLLHLGTNKESFSHLQCLIYPTAASILFQLEKVLFFRARVIRLGLSR